MMQHLRLAAIILAAAVLLGGCTRMKNNNLLENALKHMNQKYGEEFTYCGTSSLTEYQRMLVVSSVDHPEIEVKIRCTVDNGNITFMDNYVGQAYKRQTEEAVSAALKEAVGSEFYFEHQVSDYVNFDGMIPFEEYCADSDADVKFFAIIKQAATEVERSRLQASLEGALARRGLCCSGTLYFDEKAAVEQLSAEKISAYLYKEPYTEKLTFRMQTAEEFSEVVWETTK